MDLKKSIMLIVAGIIFTVILKFSNFFFPDVFNSILITKIVSLLSFLSGITVLIFGVYFIKDLSGKKNLKMNIVILLAMIGPFYFTARHFVKIIMVFNDLSLKLYEVSPGLHHILSSFNMHSSSQLILVLSSFFIFIFFYMMLKNLNQNITDLSKTIRLVLVGILLTLVFRTFGLFVYLVFPRSDLIPNPPLILHLIGFFIFLFSSLVLLIFFRKLYSIDDYYMILKN